MRKLMLVLPFIALAFLCWGAYGPLLHSGQEAMARSSLRPFLCVGVAYFVVAVIVPILLLRTQGEAGEWTLGGTFWSLAAGAAGAAGALGVIFAFRLGAKPVYVMPLVFGCAPVVNTLVTMATNRSLRQASPVFYLGVLLAALGAAGVLFFKPGERSLNIADLTVRDFVGVLIAIAVTAISWGVYGPMLHRGQQKMLGSRLRPLLCVGLSYFGMAVVVPLAMLGMWIEPGHWSLSGVLWSLAGGAAGAIGALGIILAFNFGGRPIYVMPLVFGCAPIVNTLITIVGHGAWSQVPLAFYPSLTLAIIGAVTVLVFAPKPAHPSAATDPPDIKAEAHLHSPLDGPIA
jgi:hypothetical protein